MVRGRSYLGDDLTVGSEGLGSLVLNIIKFGDAIREPELHHVHQVVESELEAHVDHVVRVGGGEDVVALGVVTEQIH